MGVGDLPLRWSKEQWRIQGRDPGPPPFISLFLDQTKARMAEKKKSKRNIIYGQAGYPTE